MLPRLPRATQAMSILHAMICPLILRPQRQRTGPPPSLKYETKSDGFPVSLCRSSARHGLGFNRAVLGRQCIDTSAQIGPGVVAREREVNLLDGLTPTDELSSLYLSLSYRAPGVSPALGRRQGHGKSGWISFVRSFVYDLRRTRPLE